MKKILIAVACIIGLLPLQITRAQSILYISNLGQLPAGSGAIGSNSWIAQTFITGSNPGGYLLSSVQLLMDAPAGTPSGFSVSIYSKTGDPHSEHEPGDSPQSSLGSLTGSAPTTGGVFSYGTPGILLSPDTFYYVVVTAATTTNDSAYAWSATSGLTQSNLFTIEDEFFSSSDGSNWTWNLRGKVFQLGLYASAVLPSQPELAIYDTGSGGISIVAGHCEPLSPVMLEMTTDFTNWTTISTNTATPNHVTTFYVSQTNSMAFFRVLAYPD